MLLQIASDLHLEFPENKEWLKKHPIIPKADVLILAGDVVLDKYETQAEEFYNKIRKDFKKIIQIKGNHEFYSGEIAYAYPHYYKELAKNHLVANNKIIIIDNVKFILSTLWSYVPPVDKRLIEECVNDYHVIYSKRGERKFPITTLTTNNYFTYSLEYLKEELKKPFDGKIVIITHHLPSFKCISKTYSDSICNTAYASELSELIEKHPNIVLWAHGHSHDFHDIIIGKTRVVRNPLGYLTQHQEKDFKRDFVVEV